VTESELLVNNTFALKERAPIWVRSWWHTSS